MRHFYWNREITNKWSNKIQKLFNFFGAQVSAMLLRNLFHKLPQAVWILTVKSSINSQSLMDNMKNKLNVMISKANSTLSPESWVVLTLHGSKCIVITNETINFYRRDKSRINHDQEVFPESIKNVKKVEWLRHISICMQKSCKNESSYSLGLNIIP